MERYVAVCKPNRADTYLEAANLNGLQSRMLQSGEVFDQEKGFVVKEGYVAVEVILKDTNDRINFTDSLKRLD